jgi:hypothetical protein
VWLPNRDWFCREFQIDEHVKSLRDASPFSTSSECRVRCCGGIRRALPSGERACLSICGQKMWSDVECWIHYVRELYENLHLRSRRNANRDARVRCAGGLPRWLAQSTC